MKARLWVSGAAIRMLSRKELSRFREGISQAIAEKMSPRAPQKPLLRQVLERRYLTHPDHSGAALQAGYEKGRQEALLEAAAALTLRAQAGSTKRSSGPKPNGNGKFFASGGAEIRRLHG